MKRLKKDEKPIFSLDNRDFNIKAWYAQDIPESKGDAIVELSYKGEVVRDIIYPAYKVYNLAAHFDDIVDSEINNDDRGYQIAGSDGLGGVVMPKKQ